MDKKKLQRISFPMDCRVAQNQLAKFLLDYEKTEILEYDTIYYLNTTERPAGKNLSTPDGPENGGFDNDKGEYLVVDKDHISYRFEIVKKIG